nr:MAG TPA: holin [Bacteriophage sp.]
MEQIINYVKPELVVLSIVLYFIGMGIKKTEKIKDNYIPMILGVLGIALCAIWVMATSSFGSANDIFAGIFTALVQGVLVAGLSVYVNQMIKQANK